MTIPQHPFRSQWQPIEVDVVGHRIVDTIEGAALEAIYLFCNQHPREVAGQPIGLFSTTNPNDPEWNLRVVPEGHRLEGSTEEALQGTMRFMNVQHHYQLLLRRGMGQLISIAQGHFRNADQQVIQIQQLQAPVTEKEEIIAAREETIHHREDQINESDAIITQRNTIIEFLQEQIHDLILEVDDAQHQIMNSNSSQHLLLYQLLKKKKILKKSKESPRSILTTEILLSVPIILLQAVSHQWATLMTFNLV
jgi:hypothetical protein